MRFEALPKSARITMRLPEPLIAAIKAEAKARGIPYHPTLTLWTRILADFEG